MKRSRFISQFRSCDAVRIEGVFDERAQRTVCAGLRKSRIQTLCISATIPVIVPALKWAIRDAPRLWTIELSGDAADETDIVVAAVDKALHFKTDFADDAVIDGIARSTCRIRTLDIRLDRLEFAEFASAIRYNQSICSLTVRLAKAWSCVHPLLIELAHKSPQRLRIVLDSDAIQSTDFTNVLVSLIRGVQPHCTLRIEGYTNDRVAAEMEWRRESDAARGPALRACDPLLVGDAEDPFTRPFQDALIREIESAQIEE
jgi:hypothetical protein